MGDLISRSELIKLINNKYIGLNDATDLYHGGKFDCFKEIKLMIKEQPTSYDLDKVVEQIKQISPANYVEKSKVIEIVKAGGIDGES